MPVKKSALVYGATEAVTFHKGARVTVHQDEPWSASDPFVKARPDLFVGDPLKVQGATDGVSSVTAEPATDDD